MSDDTDLSDDWRDVIGHWSHTGRAEIDDFCPRCNLDRLEREKAALVEENERLKADYRALLSGSIENIVSHRVTELEIANRHLEATNAMLVEALVASNLRRCGVCRCVPLADEPHAVGCAVDEALAKAQP